MEAQIPEHYAKMLKKYGFPQDNQCKWLTRRFVDSIVKNEEYYQPSLEELIFACGYGFHNLRYHTDNFWTAHSGFFTKNMSFRGKTPKEAVAKLYIKLKRKKLI